MDYLFMDEKGPQDTFEVSNPFNKEEKLKNANDRMHSYVADVIKISETAYKDIQYRFLALEEELHKVRPQMGEVKGEKLLPKKVFKYGVASLHDDKFTFKFLKQFFEILIDHINEIDNLLFEVGKMSIVVDSRLNEWILRMNEKKGAITFVLKYTLTKYMENEAPELVIKNLLDKTIPLEELLLSISDDMKKIVEDNQGNQRMAGQIEVYKTIIKLIKETIAEKIELVEPNINPKFNWEKVSWAVELMLLEIDKKVDNSDKIFYLDEGIPSSVFEKFKFKEIKEGERSDEVVGIRIVDILVAIAGKYISSLFLDSKHKGGDLTKRHLISSKWFELTNKHFDLIKQMRRIYFPKERVYSINIDTFFDDIMLFIVYVNYISTYQSYLKYNLIDSEQHVQNFMKNFIIESQNKFAQSIEADSISESLYGSVRNTINENIRKPL